MRTRRRIHSHPVMSFRNFRAAFTLVELLTVLAVVGIVLGFVVPAISGMARGTSLATAGNTVNNMAGLARQHAMSRNTLTALLVLGNQGTDSDYRACAILEYKRGAGWSQIGKWETLPTGITVDSGNTQDCSFLLRSPDPFPFLTATNQSNPPILFQGVPVSSGAYAARIFTPGGGLQNPGDPAQIRLVEGFVEGGTIRYTHRNAAGQPANYFDIAIVGATGATKISRP